MRALFVTWAWPSHFYPLVQLAWAMQAAGHDVRVASQPALTDVITRAGLTAVPVGRDVDTLRFSRPFFKWVADQDRPVEWADLQQKGTSSVRMYVMLAEAMVDDTIALTQSWRPDIIVSEPTTYASAGGGRYRHARGPAYPRCRLHLPDPSLRAGGAGAHMRPAWARHGRDGGTGHGGPLPAQHAGAGGRSQAMDELHPL